MPTITADAVISVDPLLGGQAMLKNKDGKVVSLPGPSSSKIDGNGLQDRLYARSRPDGAGWTLMVTAARSTTARMAATASRPR